MTLEQLKMLKMVAQEGSLKAASERLFKTQAALSQGIKQLEIQLGIQLFDRQKYRLSLTSQGQQIYQRALKLLDQAAEIEMLSHHFMTGHEASITLAFEGSFDLTKILPILEDIQNRFPQTQIILQQEYITGAFDALEKGNTDLVITPADGLRIIAHKFETIALYTGQMINVAAPKLLERHPKLCSAQELEKEYQIVVQDSGTGTKGLTIGVKEGQRCWYVNDLATKKMLTLSGMGWGRLPSYLVDQELTSGALKRLNFQDAQNELEITYYAIKQRNRLLGPVASQFWQSLSLLAANIESE
ncbi:MAG: LysR family transcriptional regulator [Oceanospirillaceae bacterium]|nr:LysR family transcriptional regulator [Oceanospirillaceae bacterium]